MVPLLEKIIKKYEINNNTIFNSFVGLAIGGFVNCTTRYWSTEKLNLSFLQNLSLNGYPNKNISSTFIDQFNNLSLKNLIKLTFIEIKFEKTIKFINMPSLKSLVIDSCYDLNYKSNLPFLFPNNFQLQSFTYKGWLSLEQIVHLLIQINGLEKLIIAVNTQHAKTPNLDQDIKNFINAVILQKNTLHTFSLKMPLRNETLKWDFNFVENIKLYTKLNTLFLPLVSRYQSSYYPKLIRAFPNLSSLVIFIGTNHNSDNSFLLSP